MYSRRLAPRLLLLLLALSAVVSCGRKEPPVPPPLMVAAQTKDLLVKQRGSEVLLSFSYPTLTPAGLALPQVDAVEIWEFERPLTLGLGEEEAEAGEEPEIEGQGTEAVETPETGEVEAGKQIESEEEAAPSPVSLFGAPPPTDEGTEGTEPGEPGAIGESAPAPEPRPEAELRVDPREFAALAQLRLTLQGPELAASVLGDQVIVRLPLEEGAAGDTARVFGIRVLSDKKLVSAFSNLQVLIPRLTPGPPREVAVTPRQDGVEISWQGEGDEMDGYHVYRREARSPFYGQPIFLVTPDTDRFVDSGAAFGQRYIYSVTGVLAADAPVIETALSAELELDYQDRFPPPPPANPLALAEPNRVRLLWEESEAQDVAGYKVFRREGDGEFRSLTEDPVLRLELLDTDVVSGRRYSYQIRAADRSGNESEPSEQLDVLVP